MISSRLDIGWQHTCFVGLFILDVLTYFSHSAWMAYRQFDNLNAINNLALEIAFLSFCNWKKFFGLWWRFFYFSFNLITRTASSSQTTSRLELDSMMGDSKASRQPIFNSSGLILLITSLANLFPTSGALWSTYFWNLLIPRRVCWHHRRMLSISFHFIWILALYRFDEALLYRPIICAA